MCAELTFTGGPIFTADLAMPWASSVVVRDGVIAEVLPRNEAVHACGEVIDLAGKLLIPGIHDAHIHPVMGGIERLSLDLTEISDIKAYAESRPHLAWITGGGWSTRERPPRRAELDAAIPDRPAVLINADHHSSWVNTAALRLAGVDRHTPDPPDGRIERDPDGEPSGTLHEGAMDLVSRHIPERSPSEYVAGLLEAQSYLHSFGIVGWQDAIVGEYGGYPDPSATYAALADSGRLTARVRGALWWDRDRGISQLPELIDRRESAVGMDLDAVKIMLDGVAENFTAAMSEPYLDGCGCVTENRGLSFVDPRPLRDYVTALDRAGFVVHFHAIGDAAVRSALDAVGAARAANRPSGLLHQIAHLQVVDPADVPRFRQLGVAAVVQPLWACHEPQMDEMTIPFLGPKRAQWQYPFGDLHRAGAHLAMGSDWPVSSPDPWRGIQVAVTRALSDVDRPFLPQQRLELMAALTAYTEGSAKAMGRNDSGRIVAGSRADLVVLDRDPFAGPVGEIAATKSLTTYVDGRPVAV